MTESERVTERVRGDRESERVTENERVTERGLEKVRG